MKGGGSSAGGGSGCQEAESGSCEGGMEVFDLGGGEIAQEGGEFFGGFHEVLESCEEEGGLGVGFDLGVCGEGCVEDGETVLGDFGELSDPAEDDLLRRFIWKPLFDECEQVVACGGVDQEREEEAVFGFEDGGSEAFDVAAAGVFFEGGGDAGGEFAVFLFEDAEDGCGLVQLLEITEAVMQDGETAFEIEVGDHLQEQRDVTGVFGSFEDVEELFAAEGELVAETRVEADVGGHVVELGAGSGIVLRTDDHGDGGGIQMEEGVDGALTRGDGHGTAGFEELDFLESDVSDAEVGRNGLGLFEVVMGVDAGTAHDVESPGELVLMDRGGSVHPEEELDVEAWVGVDDDFGFAEVGIGLGGLVFAEEEVMHEGGELDLGGRGAFVERGAGELGERGEREVVLLPALKNGVPELLEEGVHRGSLP